MTATTTTTTISNNTSITEHSSTPNLVPTASRLESKNTFMPLKTAAVHSSHQSKQDIIDNLIKLARQEQAKGNTSITSDKLEKLQTILEKKDKEALNAKYSKFQKVPEIPKKGPTRPNSKLTKEFETFNVVPELEKPKYPSLYYKFDLSKAAKQSDPFKSASREKVKNRSNGNNNSNNSKLIEERKRNKKPIKYFRPKQFSFKQLEYMFVNLLENIANLLDNLHLLSNLPMFPQALAKLLKQTNKLWVLILIFLIRKTISQLLNVIRKIRKVNTEKEILNLKSKGTKSIIHDDINKKYNKVLKDLKFDKMMLIIELIGNFLDLSFNVIELYGIVLPDWIMSSLNFASMAMTVYRMNKDDEYVDDDITDDLI